MCVCVCSAFICIHYLREWTHSFICIKYKVDCPHRESLAPVSTSSFFFFSFLLTSSRGRQKSFPMARMGWWDGARFKIETGDNWFSDSSSREDHSRSLNINRMLLPSKQIENRPRNIRPRCVILVSLPTQSNQKI